jgi:alpha-aminoadipic semialdehyde synthase
MAGMVDILQGLGQNLLARGYNTPFLNSPYTYMHPGLDAAKAGVRALGGKVATEGLPRDICPLVVAFTGRGRVAQGAQGVFELLPHEWVEVKDLPALVASAQEEGGREGGREGKSLQRKVYGVRVEEKDMVERMSTDQPVPQASVQSIDPPTPSSSPSYARDEYRLHPERYRPIFHERVAPYVSVLVNGIYWDQRYPRLLTKAQMKELWAFRSQGEGGREGGREGTEDKDQAIGGEKARLLAVADISCDVHGSLEFLTRTTSLERPIFNYRPDTEQSLEEVDGRGVVVGAVDILPAELPQEASLAFGDALLPLLPALLSGEGGKEGGGEDALPLPLRGAVITTRQGVLTESYRYIDVLRAEHVRAAQLFERVHGRPVQARVEAMQPSLPPSLPSSLAPSPAWPHTALSLRGHLFDKGLINQVLDVVEARGGAFAIGQCEVRPNRGQGWQKEISTVLLEVEAPTQGELEEIVRRVRGLADLMEAAEATVTEMKPPSPPISVTSSTPPSSPSPSPPASQPQATVDSPRRVLVLGAGRVSGPAVDYLGRRHQVTVVGTSPEELARLQARKGDPRPDGGSGGGMHQGLVLDVVGETEGVRKLVAGTDVVLSLLPASMHVDVARACLACRKPLVTTSYVSEALKDLDAAAAAQGLVFLNEVGLDPGMDHASAMRIIDRVKAEGGRVSSFRSVCGGLPAPGVAANTPFLYKYSWSPRGVLTAAENPALYREGGREVKVPGEALLRHAVPCPPDAFPTLRLEVLPNRDSLKYQALYGIEDAETCFRGTLRYEGWGDLMAGCQALGLTARSPVPSTCTSMATYLREMWGEGNGDGWESGAGRRLAAAGVKNPGRVLRALAWLEGYGGDWADQTSVIDAFSTLLEERLQYGPSEVDMVAMRHDVVVSGGGRKPGTAEGKEEVGGEKHLYHHTSNLLIFGDEKDSAMSVTVGKTAGVATELVLAGTLQRDNVVGVRVPTIPAIYTPLLDGLAKEGIVFEEDCQAVAGREEEDERERDSVFLE